MKIREKEKKFYKKSNSNQLNEENNLAQLIGIQNKISRILWVDKTRKNDEFVQLDEYDPNKYIYVEVINSWTKEITRLLLSRDNSYKINSGITEYNRKIHLNSNLRNISSTNSFVLAVRQLLMNISKSIQDVIKTVKFGAVGIRNLFDEDSNDSALAKEVDEKLESIQTSAIDIGVMHKFAAMGSRSLEL